MWILERGRPDHDPRDATVEPALDRRHRPDATADLDMTGEGFDDARHHIGIDRMAREGAVQIDHMQMLRARVGKEHRLRRRIVAIDRRPVHIAAREAHDLAPFQVNGGKDDQGRHFRNLCNVAMP